MCHVEFFFYLRKVNIIVMNDSIGDIIKWIGKHKYLFVTLAFLAILILFDENNLIKHFHNQREIITLKSEISDLKEQHDELVKKIDELDKDVDVMEKVAREKYGMHLENEDIFIIEE